MFRKKKKDIAIFEKNKPEIAIRDKAQADSNRESIHISDADSIVRPSSSSFPLKYYGYAVASLSGIVLTVLAGALLFPGKPSRVTLPVLPPDTGQINHEDLLPFTVERRILAVDMLEAMTGDTTQLPFSWEVISELEAILSWSIGLSSIRKQDTIYCVRDKLAGVSPIAGLVLQVAVMDTVIFAIRYTDSNGQTDLYDYDGRLLKRQFLQSPVRYGHISSRFNLTRLHPKLKAIKPHRGTDFAAPEGEEIYALADGVLIEQSISAGNGNYVKIRHDEFFTTAYLHLSRFTTHLKTGSKVRQGEVIGYVGSTGLATGPHVCLRFWRRDRQYDFIQSYPFLPAPDPLPYPERSRFFERRDSIIAAIQLLDYQ